MTGTAKLVEDIRRNTFSNQMTSILIAIVAVFLLNALTFRSFWEGLVSLAAIVFTIIVNFGVMGVAGIPLDFVTAIIAGVAIGTGIDYTIHFISRFTRELESGKSQRDAIAGTLAGTGKAILFNALSVALGFAVLLFSNVVPLRSAGILLASTMATSSLAALSLMPALLAATRITERIIRRHARSARAPKAVIAAAPVKEPAAGGSD
jgi:predicted RND superfamily exporter protein